MTIRTTRSLAEAVLISSELQRPAPATAAFQPVSAIKCWAPANLWPYVRVARVSPEDAEILRATDRIGGVPPVCHLRNGKRPLERMADEARGTRPEYTCD